MCIIKKLSITQQQASDISAVVTKAEQSTSGEIAVVVATSSASYAMVSVIAALILTVLCLLIGAPYIDHYLMTHAYTMTHFTWNFLALAAVIGSVTFSLCSISCIRLRITPRLWKQYAAKRHARIQFYEQGLHKTRDGTGILIFVSIAERYVEVIADEGIYKKLPDRFWDALVATCVQHIKAGKMARGLIAIVTDIGKELARHFPADNTHNPNEISDRVVIL